MDAEQPTNRIQSNSKTYAGKPTVRDTRVAVEHVLAMLADGATPDELLAEYPFLEVADIRACLSGRNRNDSPFIGGMTCAISGG
ncbi:MAG: DUF433 domain-containing protein [Spirochaetaceae bacterium]|nr:MAG: DUF433 domain-containing protein [Spirochaetaceae bacterium]